MESLINRANRGGRYIPQDQSQSWKFDWYSPAKEQLGNGHSAQNNANDKDSNEDDKYPFRYKTWVHADRAVSEDGQETLKLLDLSKFDKTQYTTDNNRLTAADIRGAVGGSEAIPGLSSSTDAATTANAATTAEPVTEPVAEPVAEAVAEDIEMND